MHPNPDFLLLVIYFLILTPCRTSLLNMSRGTRFLTVAVPLVLLYLLAYLRVLSVPAFLLSEETAEQILPVVSFPSLWISDT